MSRFKDLYLPDCILSPGTVSSPYYSNSGGTADSGATVINRRWQNPLHRFSIPRGVREVADVHQLRTFWRIMVGDFHTFPFKDPWYFASKDVVQADVDPGIAATDQVIGTGDGNTTNFQLIITKSIGGFDDVREVRLPHLATVEIALDGTPAPSGWSVDRYTGIVSFDSAPSGGTVITAGFLYDHEVRFEGPDVLDQVYRDFHNLGFADIPLMEERPCQG